SESRPQGCENQEIRLLDSVRIIPYERESGIEYSNYLEYARAITKGNLGMYQLGIAKDVHGTY
ncbi:MAG: hypothetical protein QW706_10165, partial [Candidatus Nezhaarchaeales archaeon]